MITNRKLVLRAKDIKTRLDPNKKIDTFVYSIKFDFQLMVIMKKQLQNKEIDNQLSCQLIILNIHKHISDKLKNHSANYVDTY